MPSGSRYRAHGDRRHAARAQLRRARRGARVLRFVPRPPGRDPRGRVRCTARGIAPRPRRPAGRGAAPAAAPVRCRAAAPLRRSARDHRTHRASAQRWWGTRCRRARALSVDRAASGIATAATVRAAVSERARGTAGVSIECNSLVAARELLLGSDFITLLSARQVRREVEAGMLVAMPHPDGRVTRPIGLTLRRDWRPTAAQQVLVQVLRRHATAA